MANNENKNPSFLPEGLSSIADDEAITEINLNDFLEEEEDSGKRLIIEGCSADIAKTEESIENELQSLYDDIMGSGPQTIVPNPMSMITSPETPEENSALGELWMDPEDYFEADIPVVALDSEEPAGNEVSQDAIFAPEAAVEEEEEVVDTAKDDIFNMIDMLKAESDESGFSSILSEIEANEGISTVSDGISAASQLVTDPAAYEVTDFGSGNADDELSPAVENDTPIDIPVPAEEKSDCADVEFELEEDYESELARILAENEPIINLQPAEEPETPSAEGFVIDIPDDGNDYNAAASQPEKLYEPESMSGGLSYFTQEEYEARIQNEEKKNIKAKQSKPAEKKKKTAGDVIRIIVLSISSVVIAFSIAFLVYYYAVNPWLVKKELEATAQQMQEVMVEQDMTGVVDPTLAKDFPDVTFPDGMLAKYAHLYAQNDDLRGWIEIPGACPLPIVVGEDNEFYLKKNFEGKRTDYGVPFFDYRMTDFKNLHTNNVIYGHNMRSDDLVFGILENYRYIDWYKEAPVIECNTIYGDYTWLVYGVFITNSNPEHDNGYFFPYNFIDMPESEFAQYIEELDKRKLYTTGVDINTSDKILTLSTCAYDFTDARLVVVARLKREGESVSVDTSKAYENPNPKYPQKWYDVNKKSNPYAEDSRW